MHLEILVEGKGDKKALSVLLEKIVGKHSHPHTWVIHSYRGVGDFPDFARSLDKIKPNKNKQNAIKHTLLGSLPLKLKTYGDEKDDNLAVVVLVDLDDKDCIQFKKQLLKTLDFCQPAPKVLFRIAIEELEAWFLGDGRAIKKAYPNVDKNILNSYDQDEICGTWETLADAVYPGGCKKLHSQYGKRATEILTEKMKWASKICPYMDVENNESPSFRVFRDGIRNMIAKHEKPPLPRPRA